MDREELLQIYALKFVGLPYNWGGDDPIKGFDCSGFVIEILKAFGVVDKNFDGTAQTLFGMFPKPMDGEISCGCLVFYGKSPTQVSHVGFALNESLMLEAGGGGSSTTSEALAALQNAYIRIRPIDSRKDFVGFNLPPWGI